MMHNDGPRFRSVELCGSFDDWKTRYPMTFDSYSNDWFLHQHLKKGKYTYKYVIDGHRWVVNYKEQREKDPSGNENNVITL